MRRVVPALALAAVTAMAFAACQSTDSLNPVAPNTLPGVVSSITAGATKVDVCHYDDEGNPRIINIAVAALQSHLENHGDNEVGVEQCNGIDDDCDGAVDDGIADVATGTDVGACQPEILSCIDGGFQVIQPGIGPVPEVCDSLDNNCDGEVDELRPSCDCGDRYEDRGDGTVKDCKTDLIWLKDAGCARAYEWQDGMTWAANVADGDCGLSDGSSAGDWRLPTKDEWRVPVFDAINLDCTITEPYPLKFFPDDAGTGCWTPEEKAFFHVQGVYWSSTSVRIVPHGPLYAFVARLGCCQPNVVGLLAVNEFHVWAVRD